MNFIILIVAFFEGFATLAVEIIAIRNTITIVGSSIILTSIVLGIILLALSFGYYFGGFISKKCDEELIKYLLALNFVLSSFLYSFVAFYNGNFILENILNFFDGVVISLFLYFLLFFFVPVFLVAQSVPMLTELINSTNKGESSGKILFFSTIGSVLGSVITSLVFFPFFGVYKTGFIIGLILLVCSVLIYITKKVKTNKYVFLLVYTIILYLLLFYFFKGKETGFIYSYDSPYQSIKINEYYYKGDLIRYMKMDKFYSSIFNVTQNNNVSGYIKQVESITKLIKPNNILMIGGAGFTYPYSIMNDDYLSNIDVIDVEPKMKQIAENFFLQSKLNKKINFIVSPARLYVNNSVKNGIKYDFIFVDVYYGSNVPSQLLTYEFYENLKKLSNKIIFNHIFDLKLESNFSKRVLNTIKKSFGMVYYKMTPTNDNPEFITNFLVSTFSFDNFNIFGNNELGYYVDDKHSIEIDGFILRNKYNK